MLAVGTQTNGNFATDEWSPSAAQGRPYIQQREAKQEAVEAENQAARGRKGSQCKAGKGSQYRAPKAASQGHRQ